ncbi:MAG: hypothetical protein QGG74_06045 [Phycisphaerales bacterium]|jgi:hypothetical protein|nr:hypothetical protein [Phycisphaerales bacterium]
MISFAGLLVTGVTVLGGTAFGDGAGRWKGAWTLPGEESRDLVLSIEPTNGGNFVGRAVSLAGGMQPQPLPTLAIDGDVVTFEPMVGAERLRFRGKRSDDGQTISGVVTGGGLASPGVFHLDHRPMVRTTPNHMIYGADISIAEDELVPLTVHLRRQDDGWLAEVDLPESGVVGYPVDIQGTNGVLMLSLPASGGGEPRTLTMQPGESIVAGLWGRGQQVRVVELHRDRATPTRRPQVPEVPYSWKERSVRVESPGEPVLSGVLSLPSGGGPFPMAVLLGDEGTDRDGTIEGHPLLLVLTDALTEAGIATLRLDEAGSDFVSRRRGLRRWMEWVGTQADIDSRYVAIIGHGEGGSIAARHTAAFDEGVAAIALLSAPGLPGRLIESARLGALLAESDVQPDAIEAVVAAYETYLEHAIKSVHVGAIRESAKAWLTAQRSALGLTGPPSDEAVQSAVDRSQDQRWKHWLSYDPRATMPRIQGVPVLAMQGDRDATFDAGANLTALVDSASPRGVSIEPRLLSDLNHLLQPVGASTAPSPKRIRTTIAPSALRSLLEWIKPQLLRGPASSRTDQTTR